MGTITHICQKLTLCLLLYLSFFGVLSSQVMAQTHEESQNPYIETSNVVAADVIDNIESLRGNTYELATKNGDFYVSATNDGGLYQGYSLIRFNKAGNIVFQKKYEVSGDYRYFHIRNIISFENGDILVTALAAKLKPVSENGIENPSEAGKEGMYLARINPLGELVWSRYRAMNVGGVYSTTLSDDNIKILVAPFVFLEFDGKGFFQSYVDYSSKAYDYPKKGIALDNGNTLIAGFKSYQDSNKRRVYYTHGANDPYMAEIDPSGNVVWHKRYFDKNTANRSLNILKKKETGYYLLYQTSFSREYYKKKRLEPEYTRLSSEDIANQIVSSIDERGEVEWQIKLPKGVSIYDTVIFPDDKILALANHNTPEHRNSSSKPLLYLFSADGEILEKKKLDKSAESTIEFYKHINMLEDGSLQIIANPRARSDRFKKYSFIDLKVRQ